MIYDAFVRRLHAENAPPSGLLPDPGGEAASAVDGPPNTLFVCRSRPLCSAVQQGFAQLLLPLGVSLSPAEVLQAAFIAPPDSAGLPQPLFLSTAELFVLIDRSLADEPSARWFRSPQEEADFISGQGGSADSLSSLCDGADGGGGRRACAPRGLLTFEGFVAMAEEKRRAHEWPKSYDGEVAPSVVYREICSVIRGSAEAVAAKGGALDREAYLALPSRATDLPPAQRRDVYTVYEEIFKKWKRASGLYDLLDLVHHLHGQLERRGFRGAPLHKIVIDEVQDLTQAE